LEKIVLLFYLSFACYCIPSNPFLLVKYYVTLSITSSFNITWSSTSSVPHQYPLPLPYFILSLRPAATPTHHTHLIKSYNLHYTTLATKFIINKTKRHFFDFRRRFLPIFFNFVAHCTPCTPLFNILGPGAKPFAVPKWPVYYWPGIFGKRLTGRREILNCTLLTIVSYLV